MEGDDDSGPVPWTPSSLSLLRCCNALRDGQSRRIISILYLYYILEKA